MLDKFSLSLRLWLEALSIERVMFIGNLEAYLGNKVHHSITRTIHVTKRISKHNLLNSFDCSMIIWMSDECVCVSWEKWKYAKRFVFLSIGRKSKCDAGTWITFEFTISAYVLSIWQSRISIDLSVSSVLARFVVKDSRQKSELSQAISKP